ncbi:MAG: FAD-dependent oxidoreductase [Anaerolineae bacterium]
MPNGSYDVIIIGAGVVGSLIARSLSRFKLRILLLDKAADVGEGTTKANTAIVHAGYDATPGSHKARLNVAGNAMFDGLCAELDVEFDRCGTYVVGVAPEDLVTLEGLKARGRENGVPGLQLIDGEEMRTREPAVTPDSVGALYAPTGGIVDPFNLCIAAAESAVLNGVEVALETEVLDFLWEGERIVGVRTNRGLYRSGWVVNAAGLWADELMHKAGVDSLRIRPRRGEYFVLDRVAAERMHSVLFPCPTPISKGIMVTRTIHGNVMLGPNAEQIDDKEDVSTTSVGLNEVMAGALRLVPLLNPRDVIRTFAGLRATGSSGDFVIDIPRRSGGLLTLAGIESPGLTASPAIAGHVVELLREAGLPLVERADWVPERRGIPRFARLSRAEQERLIQQDPRYAHVVCRCETVTEGEIVAACHAPIPARTYDAVKRRTRLGTGRCQGAFDTPLAIAIIARELGIPPLEVTRRGGASRFLTRLSKEVTA